LSEAKGGERMKTEYWWAAGGFAAGIVLMWVLKK
jgi:hypothetical protein